MSSPIGHVAPLPFLNASRLAGDYYRPREAASVKPEEEDELKRLQLQALRDAAKHKSERGTRIAAWIIGPILVLVVLAFFIGLRFAAGQ